MADGSIIIDTQLDSHGFTKGLSSLGKKAKAGLAAITAAFALASFAAIKVGMDFEAGMSKVAAISGAAAEDMDILTEKAKEMGEKTKFSATEAAEAFSYMAMAGWKTEEMLGGIEGIMNLAAASGEELGLVSDIVTDALTAFGLKARDAGRFADVLAAASSNSNTNVAMMGATFKYAAPIAGALGYTIEDTAVAIGLMANAGIKADQAGTSLRSVMTRLAAPPRMAAKAIDALDLSLTNADGTMKPFSVVIDDLRGKFAGMTKEQQVANAKALAGQEAMSGLLAIVNAAPADVDKLRLAILKSAGAAERMAEVMQDNLKGQLVILGSTLEGLGIKIYDKFEKPFRAAVKSAIKDVGNLSKSMGSGQLSKSVDTIAEGFGDLVKGLANLTTKIIPPLITGFALLVENARKIVATLVAIKAGMIAMAAVKSMTTVIAVWQTAALSVNLYSMGLTVAAVRQAALNGTLTMMEVITGVLTGKIALATAAQAAWNTVCGLFGGPIGLAITAIAALTAGIGIFILTQKDQKTEMDHLTESIQEQKQSWEELQEAQDASIEKNLAEIDNTQRFWSELQTLVDVNGQVIGNKERAKFLTDEINKLAPESIKWIDGETSSIIANTEAIDQLIAKKRAQIILEAQEPAYKEAILNYQEKQIEQAKLKIVMDKELADVETARQEVEKGGGDIALAVLATKKKALAETEAIYAENDRFLETYYGNIASYEQGMVAISNNNYAQIDKINSQYGLSYRSAGQATKVELDQQIKELEEWVPIATEKVASGQSNMTQVQLDEAKKRLAALQAEKIEQEKAWTDLGLNSSKGYAQGILSGQTFVTAALNKVIGDAPKQAKSILQIHSPSRVFQDQIGTAVSEGFALGITKNASMATKAVEGMALAAILAAKVSLDQAKFHALGKMVGGALAQGLQTAESLLQSTMTTIGDKLIDAHLTNAEKLGFMESQTEEERYNKLKALGIEQINKNYLAFMVAEKEKVSKIEAKIAKLKDMTTRERNQKVKEIELKAVGEKAAAIAKLEKRLLEKKEDEIADLSAISASEKQERVTEIETRYVQARNQALFDLELKSLEDEAKLADQFITEYNKAFEKLVTEYENANQRIMDSQTRLEEKLSTFGALYDTVKDADGKDTGLINLHDIQGDIDKLDAYGTALETLKSKKPPDGFMDEVLSMDIDEALKYMTLLNGQQDKDFDAYTTLWQEKQTKSKEIAQRYYSDQFNTLKTDFTDKIDKQMGLLPDDAKKIGLESAKKLAEGITGNSSLVFTAIDALIEKFNAMRDAASDAQQAAADATGAGDVSQFASRSGYTVTNNDHGVQQTMNFYSPVASPGDIARANRQAGRALARG